MGLPQYYLHVCPFWGGVWVWNLVVAAWLVGLAHCWALRGHVTCSVLVPPQTMLELLFGWWLVVGLLFVNWIVDASIL